MGGGLEMTTSDYAKSQIATACWRAAKSELHPIMLAVCQVFMNRAAAGWFDSDLYENCTHWLVENPGEFPDLRDPQFQSLLSRLETVTSGMASDKTEGALYFANKQDLPEKIEGTVTTTIGGIVFIK
jgi:hypothetical protein